MAPLRTRERNTGDDDRPRPPHPHDPALGGRRDNAESGARDSRQTTPIVRSLALLDKDPRYDRRTGHAALPIEVCLLDGSKITTTLEMDPVKVLLLSAQLERAVAPRAKAQEAAVT